VFIPSLTSGFQRCLASLSKNSALNELAEGLERDLP